MLLRVSCEIAFTLPEPTAMVLMLYLHPSVAARVRKPERLGVTPHVSISEYTDVYGNHCGRVVAAPGLAAFSNDAVVEDDGRPDPQVWNAYQHQVQDLPHEVLLFLLANDQPQPRGEVLEY